MSGHLKIGSSLKNERSNQLFKRPEIVVESRKEEKDAGPGSQVKKSLFHKCYK
jgi:hypothetical protein